MKLVKSLLLGSAAGLSAVAGAQAADLPVRKAAPVEYVRICSAYGAGFFYIPGTDTCLRVGGRARAEAEFRNQRSVGGDNSGYRGLGRLNIDARTQTPYGTLRAFVRFEIAKRTGLQLSGTNQRQGEAIIGIGADNFGRAQTDVQVDKAFIQFAGFTAGRAASFFDFYAHDLEIQGNSSGSDVSSTQVFAYTATFGSGWSATIAIEDPTERRQPFFNTAGAGSNGLGGLNSVLQGFNLSANGFLGSAATAGGVTTAGAATTTTGPAFNVPGVAAFSATPFTGIANAFDPATGLPISFVNLDVAQRNKMPDIVGVLRVDQAWGSAQLSGAVHELSFGTFTGTGGTIAPATGAVTATAAATGFALPAARRPDTEYGFAVQGGLKFNLPMIAAGDILYLQAAYGDGAINYAGVTPGFIGQDLTSTGLTNKFGFLTTDAAIDAFGNVHKTEAFVAVAAFLHYWTPELRSAFSASYASVEFDQSLRTAFGPAGNAPFTAATALGISAPGAPGTVGAQALAALSPAFMNYEIYTASANLIWSPVKDLDIGVEGFYIRTELDGRVINQNKPFAVTPAGVVVPVTAANLGAGAIPRTTNFDDQFVGRVRVQRDF